MNAVIFVNSSLLPAAERRVHRPPLRVCCAAAIGFRFRAQRLFGDRSDQRLVVGRDDDDAALGDGVATAILFDVISDERAAWNQDVAVDDRPAKPRVPAHPHARHQNRLLDLAEAVDADVRDRGCCP